MMERYALFVGDCFYPKGGWWDFRGSFTTQAAAQEAATEPEEDCVSGWWFNIVDLQTGDVLAQETHLPSRWGNRNHEPVIGALTGDEESLFATTERIPLRGRGL